MYGECLCSPKRAHVLQRFTRVGTHGTHLRRAIDLKSELELALLKGRELDLEPTGRPKCGVSGAGTWGMWSE